jgi:hypothetical protein
VQDVDPDGVEVLSMLGVDLQLRTAETQILQRALLGHPLAGGASPRRRRHRGDGSAIQPTIGGACTAQAVWVPTGSSVRSRFLQGSTRDIHLPEARHRDAAAIEAIAGASNPR